MRRRRNKKQQEDIVIAETDRGVLTQTYAQCYDAVMQASKLGELMDSMSSDEARQFIKEILQEAPVVLAVWQTGPVNDDDMAPYDFRVIKGLATAIENAKNPKSTGAQILALPCGDEADADFMFTELGDGKIGDGALQ